MLLLWFTNSVTICLCTYVLENFLFWIAPFGYLLGKKLSFGFLLGVFWLWCRCFECVLLSLWCLGRKLLGNCIDSWSLPYFYSYCERLVRLTHSLNSLVNGNRVDNKSNEILVYVYFGSIVHAHWCKHTWAHMWTRIDTKQHLMSGSSTSFGDSEVKYIKQGFSDDDDDDNPTSRTTLTLGWGEAGGWAGDNSTAGV